VSWKHTHTQKLQDVNFDFETDLKGLNFLMAYSGVDQQGASGAVFSLAVQIHSHSELSSGMYCRVK
jgi:hypothetical protein